VDFLLVENVQDFYRVIFSSIGPAFVGQETKKYLLQEIKDRIERYPDLSDPAIPIPLKAHFIYGAMLHTIIWWLEDTSRYSAEEMADKVYQLLVSQPV
jgi:hypothetical protein